MSAFMSCLQAASMPLESFTGSKFLQLAQRCEFICNRPNLCVAQWHHRFVICLPWHLGKPRDYVLNLAVQCCAILIKSCTGFHLSLKSEQDRFRLRTHRTRNALPNPFGDQVLMPSWLLALHVIAGAAGDALRKSQDEPRRCTTAVVCCLRICPGATPLPCEVEDEWHGQIPPSPSWDAPKVFMSSPFHFRNTFYNHPHVLSYSTPGRYYTILLKSLRCISAVKSSAVGAPWRLRHPFNISCHRWNSAHTVPTWGGAAAPWQSTERSPNLCSASHLGY